MKEIRPEERKARSFWQGIFMGEGSGASLLANKCPSCGRIFFPEVRFCYDCRNGTLDKIALGRSGKLHSYTIGHMASLKFQPPYAVGFIDMPEGVRVFSPLQIVEGKPLKIGMEMQMTVKTIWQDEDGGEVLGYVFEPK
jgi:uncharacterized OB-fold protein